MRLIDAERFEAYDCKTNACAYEGEEFHSYLDGMQRVLEDLDDAPTVDPERLPIVKQLRAELGKVKAERDAAVRDIKWLVSGEIKACAYCKKNNPYNYTCENDGMGMCEHWEWRGAKEG